MDAISKVPESIFTLFLPINTSGEDPSIQAEFVPRTSSKYTSLCKDQGNGRLILGFLDKEKVDGSSNAILPLIITIIIANQYVFGVLVDDESSCDLIYFEILARLGLRLQDLKSCKEQSLLTFKNSSTRPCEQIYLLVTLGKWSGRKTTSVYFFVIPCESAYNDILGQSFFIALDVVSSLVHFKLKCHDESDRPIVIKEDLLGALRMPKTGMKKPTAASIS